MSRVLAIGDLHAPCTRVGYMQFCKDLYKKHKCNSVIFMGDVVDHHAISFHAHHPEMPGPKDEYELTYQHIQKWYKAFPKSRVCLGNHDSRIVRLAESVAIPSKFLRDYREIWSTPNWEWDWDFLVDDVCYQHGIATGGLHPAYNMMRKMALSVVLGHNHTASGLKWLVNPHRRLFGMDVGCGIDDREMAFAYGKHTKIRSVLSAGVILDGIPYLEIMNIGVGEQYHDSKHK